MTYETLLCCRDALRNEVLRLRGLGEAASRDFREALDEVQAEIKRMKR